jgi:hypothetical protein
MLILDKRKAVERVVAMTVEGAAAEPEPRPRRGRKTERREAKRARRRASARREAVAAIEQDGPVAEQPVAAGSTASA